jgi:hypothetical protein
LKVALLLKQVQPALALEREPGARRRGLIGVLFVTVPPALYLGAFVMNYGVAFRSNPVVIAAAFVPPAMGAMFGWLSIGWLRKRARHRRDLGDPLGTLAEEFPDELRSWGGPDALRHRGTLRNVIARWESGETEEPPEPGSTGAREP